MTDWTIPDQSREAQLARFAARLEAIFASGAEEARKADPVVREYLRLRDKANDAGCTLDEAIGWRLAREAVAERRAEYEALHCDGMHEALKAAEHHWKAKAAAERKDAA